jgi:hypothetical protein
MKRVPFFILAGGVVLLAIVSGAWYWEEARLQPAAATTTAERKVLYWTDPMVPGYRSDKPGKSPFMDMELVPVYADDPNAEQNVIAVKPEIANSLGIRTHTVTRAQPARRIETQGYVFRYGGVSRVLVDLFDRDAEAVRVGQSAEVRVPSAPGRRFRGVVEHLEADVGIGLRSVKATIRIHNPDGALKPNLFAEATIESAAASAKLLVPREALIRTGRRTAVVLALGDGRFQPVEVMAGAEYDDQVEILRGIKEGDTVVTSGQFLIDSEASVRASFQRMETSPADHSSHEAKP